MAYSELIHRLLTVNLEGGIKLGLQNVQRLQHILEYPDRSFASIHVAGTNGKGSVCIKVAHTLEKAGYRVGLFTSPHISCFRERIKINGEMIPEEAVETILPGLFQCIENASIPATFFELTTFLALLYFAREQVDVAVLETGLGGRLDATNVVMPCLSIITSISLDHTELLGLTHDEIAKEKGGIIKAKVPVIIGPHVPFSPIKAIAEHKKSRCIQVKQTSSYFEMENRFIAQRALELLSSRFDLPSAAIKLGLEKKQPCRFEVVEGPPLIILDVAHNPDGIFHLFQSITHDYPEASLRLLFGLSKSKDIKGCLENITSYSSFFHLVESTNGRGAAKELIKDQLLEIANPQASIFLYPSIAAGVQAAREEALKLGQVLVIFGSFFIMKEVRQTLGFREPTDVFDLNERNHEKKLSG